MRKSRYTESQILNILKQADQGVAIDELCREWSSWSSPLKNRTT